MKIERTCRPATVPVSEIKPGNAFILDGRAYMVLVSLSIPAKITGQTSYGVDLETGHITNILSNEAVIPHPDAKVVL